MVVKHVETMSRTKGNVNWRDPNLMAVNTALARIKTSAAECHESCSDWSIGANSVRRDMGTSCRGSGLKMRVLRAAAYLSVVVFEFTRRRRRRRLRASGIYSSIIQYNSGCPETPAIEYSAHHGPCHKSSRPARCPRGG